MNMAKTLVLTRSATKKELYIYISYPINTYFIVFGKNKLLNPIDRKAKDDSVLFGDIKAYYTYHQRRGYTIDTCKSLEVIILDLICQGKYEILLL